MPGQLYPIYKQEDIVANYNKEIVAIWQAITANKNTLNTKNITAAYTTVPEDGILFVDTTAARTITLSLRSRAVGRYFVIIDSTGNASVGNITITPETPATINGGASVTINTNYGSKIIFTDKVNWFSH